MSPMRPKVPCATRGCPALVVPSSRWCVPHAKEQEQHRGTATARGYGSDHRRWREDILGRDVLCVDPVGRHPMEVRRATVADHIVPLRQGGRSTLDNGQGLCEACHSAKRQVESRV